MSRAQPGTDAALDRACRRLLLAYPRDWRDGERGEELFWVLYESAESLNRLRPRASDAVNVIGHGLATRLRATNVFLPEPARRHLAETALAAGTALSVFLLGCGEIRIPGWSNGASPGVLDDWLRHPVGPFQTLGLFIYALWIAAAIAFVAGQAYLVRELTIGAGVMAMAVPELSAISDRQRPPGGLIIALVLLAVGAALLPTRRRPLPKERIGVACAGVVGAAVLLAWRAYWLDQPTRGGFPRAIRTARTIFYWSPNDNGQSVNRALASFLTWIVVGLIVLAAAVWVRDRTWLPAAVFLILPVSVLRIGTTAYDIHPAPHAGDRAIEIGGAVVAVIVLNGLVVTTLARRSAARRQAREQGT